MACGSTLLYYISHIAVLYFSGMACGHNHRRSIPFSMSYSAAAVSAIVGVIGEIPGRGWMASMASPLGSSIAGSSAGRCWTKHSKPKMYVVSSEYLRQLMPTFAKKKVN